ncbi:MAG: prepilin-type N-terminal cleavage/methylation domain-containing protein [Phycisphaerales bacterium]
MSVKRSIRRGFTLIEILIVVIILGILAAIVIPQFTNASQEAVESSVKTQLQTIRGQVELYRVKSGGTIPDGNDDGTVLFAALTNPGDLDGDGVDEKPFLAKPPAAPKDFAWTYNSAAVAPDQVFSVTYTGTVSEWTDGVDDPADW